MLVLSNEIHHILLVQFKNLEVLGDDNSMFHHGMRIYNFSTCKHRTNFRLDEYYSIRIGLYSNLMAAKLPKVNKKAPRIPVQTLLNS